MVSSHDATSPCDLLQGLVTGTSPIVCADLNIVSLISFSRALKKKGNTPKYGLIFHSSFIGRAGAKNKGRVSRYLANKCSIASRIDCFAGTAYYYFEKQT